MLLLVVMLPLHLKVVGLSSTLAKDQFSRWPVRCLWEVLTYVSQQLVRVEIEHIALVGSSHQQPYSFQAIQAGTFHLI